MSKSICFVGSDSYPVLNRNVKDEYFGGEAVQQTILAKGFRDFGYQVSMICLDYGQPQGEIRDGIQVFKTHRKNAGIPVIRFLYPRASSVFGALKRANADVYFQSCAGASTGIVARFCLKQSKTFIFRAASDVDCVPGEQLIRFYRDKKLYEYGLRRANIVSVQSHHQQSLLARNYALNSHIVNMVCDVPTVEVPTISDIDVLWVSNIRECKCPDKILQLARLRPEIKFTMIGGVVAGEEALYRKIRDTAASIPNLEFLGAVSYHEIGEYFARSKIFVNTSDIEGFPNTFLQAWSNKTPVVSFFDPDNLIERHTMGISPSGFEDMICSVDSLLKNSEKRTAMGDAGYQFVGSNYSAKAIAAEYDRLIMSSCSAGQS